jgi:hypothetical protein
MACCGSKRAELKRLGRQQAAQIAQTMGLPPPPEPAAPPTALPDGTPAPPPRLAYRSAISVVVSGPVTGRSYVFPPGQQAIEVDPQDLELMLDSGRFVQA